MERLTECVDGGISVKENYGESSLKTIYQCYGEKPFSNYSNCDEGYCAMEKLAEYEDLEEQGLLLKFQFKIGDKVYMIGENEVIPFKISSLMIYGNCIYVTVKYSGNNEDLKFLEVRISEKDIENRLFFTKEEAENSIINLEKDGEKQ